jgi:hypothetical protein
MKYKVKKSDLLENKITRKRKKERTKGKKKKEER